LVAELGLRGILPFVRPRFYPGDDFRHTIFQPAELGLEGYLGLGVQIR
jgi:hypothetical protein